MCPAHASWKVLEEWSSCLTSGPRQKTQKFLGSVWHSTGSCNHLRTESADSRFLSIFSTTNSFFLCDFAVKRINLEIKIKNRYSMATVVTQDTKLFSVLRGSFIFRCFLLRLPLPLLLLLLPFLLFFF